MLMRGFEKIVLRVGFGAVGFFWAWVRFWVRRANIAIIIRVIKERE